LGESLPKVAFGFWTCLPSGFEDLVCGERASLVEQLPGEVDRRRRGHWFLRHWIDPRTAVGQRPAESIPRTRLAGSPDLVPVPLDSWLIAPDAAGQEVRETWITRHEPIGLLVTVATEETDRDGWALFGEYTPHAT